MVENLVLAAIAIAVVGIAMVAGRIASARKGAQGGAREDSNEALFRSMFPELQPHFHPERMVQFVPARRRRGWPARQSRWEEPAGIPAAAAAELEREGERERVRLLDGQGKVVGEFTYEQQPEGGVLRIGKGKLTVDLRKPGDPRVRYWHPEREFKWSRAGWVFKTPVADEPFESSSSRSGFSSSDSSSGSTRTAAAAAGIVGLGGTFDGGGASAGWDDAPAGSSSASPGGSSGDSSGVSSADSSGDSGGTSY